MSEKRMIRRRVAIAFGTMCILLVGALTGVLLYFFPLINNKNDSISSLEYQNNQLNANNRSLQNQVHDLDSQVEKLQDQFKNLRIAGYGNSTIWVDNDTRIGYFYDNVKLTWGGNLSAPYPGYLVFQVSSKQGTTYVEVQELLIDNSTFSHDGPLYHVKVGLGGTAVFPILPAAWIWMFVGDTVDPTVTITYYY